MSALAIDDSYNSAVNTPLNVPAPGVLANDKGIPNPTAVPISGGDDYRGGTVTLNADGSFSYTPANNFSGTDTFTYTATNVQPPNDSTTVTIKVAEAPVVTTSSGSLAYSEGAPAAAIDGALTVTDADDTNLESGQVRISANFETADELVFAAQNGITGTYDSGTGVLTLSGTASVPNYQTALRSIQFRHTGDNPAPVEDRRVQGQRRRPGLERGDEDYHHHRGRR